MHPLNTKCGLLQCVNSARWGSKSIFNSTGPELCARAHASENDRHIACESLDSPRSLVSNCAPGKTGRIDAETFHSPGYACVFITRVCASVYIISSRSTNNGIESMSEPPQNEEDAVKSVPERESERRKQIKSNEWNITWDRGTDRILVFHHFIIVILNSYLLIINRRIIYIWVIIQASRSNHIVRKSV